MKRFSAAAVLACLVLACLGGAPAALAGKKTVKLAHISSVDSVTHVMSLAFKKAVEAALPDMEVQVFPAGQLGGTVALMQGLQLNMVQIYPEFPFIWEGVVPEFKVWAVHYKFGSSEACEAFANSPLHGQMINRLVKKANVRLIGHVDAGTFAFLSNRPVRTIADVKGMKNRVAQMAPLMACWRAYGASPTPLDWGEVYTSLATGVIEGLDNPMPDMYAEKFYEVTRYLNLTNNLYNVFSFNTSEAFWRGLSVEEKEAFRQAVRRANMVAKAWNRKRRVPIETAMKEKGIRFVETDLAGFPEAVKANIDTILGGNEEAIAVYHKIMAGDYTRVE